MINGTIKGSEILCHRGRPDLECSLKIYDFKRPDRLSRDQISTLQAIHESMARQVAATLTASLRTPVKASVYAVDQMCYEEFLGSIPSLARKVMVDMSPLRGMAVLSVDTKLADHLVSRALGGTEPGSPGDLTPLEEAVLSKVVGGILEHLREAWKPVVGLELRLHAIHTNPLFSQHVPPSCMVVLAEVHVSFGSADGFLNFCYPYTCLEPIAGRLSLRTFDQPSARKANGLGHSPVRGMAVASELCFRAESLSLAEIAALKPGGMLRIPGLDRRQVLLVAPGGTTVELEPLWRGEGVPRIALRLAAARRAEQTLPAGREAWLRPSACTGAEAAKDSVAAAVRDGIAPLVSDLKAGLTALGSGLAAIRERQEELADVLMIEGRSGTAAPPSSPAWTPLAFLGPDCVLSLAPILAQEHAQAIALVLSIVRGRFDAAVGGRLLEGLPEDRRADVVRRVAALSPVSQEIIGTVGEALARHFSAARAVGPVSLGGVEVAADILAASSRSVERSVVETLGRIAPEAAREIKGRVLGLEDLVLLDEHGLAACADAAGLDNMARALKTLDAELREEILGRCGPERAEGIRERMGAMGRVRLPEVEAAQRRILDVLRELHASGSLTMGTGGETRV